MMDHRASYSLCWEDPALVCEALAIGKDDRVLAVASGGENVFAILLQNSARVVAIDTNPAQLHLLRLKIAAIQRLSYEECAAFLGFTPCSIRKDLFTRLKKQVPQQTRAYWESHPHDIETGVIHSGRFERYLARFRRYILPCILSKNRIKEYLALQTIPEQKRFYETVWNTWRWRMLFRIFFSKALMQTGRAKAMFSQNTKHDVAGEFKQRAERGITRTPVQDNWFMHYLLTGTSPLPSKGHPYLDRANFMKLKKTLGRIEIVQGDARECIKRSPRGAFTKYALSDIFEPLAQAEYESTLADITRITKRGKVCYWNNLVPRYEHPTIKGLVQDTRLSTRLQESDRVFFYARFIVEDINRRPR